MCFDVKTGYLVKTTAHVKSEMGESRFDSILSEYRADGPVKSAHYIQTVVGGQPLNIEITQVVVNAPLPEGAFNLPDDVRALKEKQVSAATNAKPRERPILKRKK